MDSQIETERSWLRLYMTVRCPLREGVRGLFVVRSPYRVFSRVLMPKNRNSIWKVSVAHEAPC